MSTGRELQDLRWTSAGKTGERLRNQGRAQPGWYWVLYPNPQSADEDGRMMSPIHLSPNGRISGPVLNLPGLTTELIAGAGPTPTFFSGPLRPGKATGRVEIEIADGPYALRGEVPPAPGWYWCQTRTAQLSPMDQQGVSPLFIEKTDDGALCAWSIATLDGRSIPGSMSVMRRPVSLAATLLDAIPLPVFDGPAPVAEPDVGAPNAEPSAPEPVAPEPVAPEPVAPEPSASKEPAEAHAEHEEARVDPVELIDGAAVLRVTDFRATLAFYERLGFVVLASHAEHGWARIERGGLRVELVTNDAPALFFDGPAEAKIWLESLDIVPEVHDGGVTVVDPEGRRIVIRTPTPAGTDGRPDGS